MAPGLTEDTFQPTVSPTVEATNGKRAVEDNAAPATGKKGKYNAIPGPLGLASASLEGKVALVTGAGKSTTRKPALHASPASLHIHIPAVCLL